MIIKKYIFLINKNLSRKEMTYSSWVVEKNFIKRLLQEYKLVSYSASATTSAFY